MAPAKKTSVKKTCTCNPHDLLFEECSCANRKFGDYDDSWIDQFSTTLDNDLPDPANRTIAERVTDYKDLTEDLAFDMALADQHPLKLTPKLTFQEQLGLKPVGVNLGDYDSNEIFDRESSSSHQQPEDDHQSEHNQELEEGSLVLGTGSYGSFHHNKDEHIPEALQRLMRERLGEYNDNSNDSFQQDAQAPMRNDALAQGDARVANEEFCPSIPTEMDFAEFCKAGLDLQPNPFSDMGIQGAAGQCDFTQERADYNNVMNFSDIGNSGAFTNGFTQPINASGQYGNDTNPFNVFGSVFDPMPSMHPQSSLNCWDSTSTLTDLFPTQIAGSEHVNGNVPIQHLASQNRSTTLARDEPQVLSDDEVFARDQAAARANVRRSQEDGHPVKVRSAQGAGQTLFGVHMQSQQSSQRPSAQTTSVSRAAPASKKLSANQLGKQPVPQPSLSSPAKPTSTHKLSSNQLDEQPFPQSVQQPSSSSSAGPSSKKRPRPADIQTPSKASKRARTTTPAPALPPFAAEVESDAARGRAVKVLLKLPWSSMTQVEKARMLLPMVNGQHPLEFEKEEMEQGLSYGTLRQRQALQKTMRLRNEAVAEAASAPKKTPILTQDMDEDDELAALKARMAEIEANKKAKIAEEKKLIDNDKRAAAMRRKRLAEKKVKQAVEDAAEKEKAESEEAAKNSGPQMAPQQMTQQQMFQQQMLQQQMIQQQMFQQQMAQQGPSGVRSIAEEQVRLAREAQEQQMGQNFFSVQENPFAHLGFAPARPFEP